MLLKIGNALMVLIATKLTYLIKKNCIKYIAKYLQKERWKKRKSSTGDIGNKRKHSVYACKAEMTTLGSV